MIYSRTYVAQSIFVSKTFWATAAALLIAILEQQNVINVIPPAVMPYVSAVLAVANVALRFSSVRPVAMVAPGSVKAVEVPMLPEPRP